LIAGGSLLGLALLIGIGYLGAGFISGFGGGDADFAYLPDNTKVLISVQVADLLESDMVQKALSDPQAKAAIDKLKQEIGMAADEDLTAIQAIIVGVANMPQKPSDGLGGGFGMGPLGGGMPDFSKADMIAVDRKNSAWNQDVLKSKAKESTHNSTTYFVANAGDMAGFFPDEKTLVLGNESSLKKAIERGKGESSQWQFDFVDFDQHIVIAGVPRDKSVLKQNSSTPMMPGMPSSAKELAEAMQKIEGGAFGVTIGSDIELQVQGSFSDSSAAGDLKAALADGLSEGPKKMDEAMAQQKTQMENAPPQFQEMMQKQAEEMNEMMEIGRKVFDSISVSRSGSAISISATLPSELGDKLKEQLPGGLGMLSAVQTARGAARGSGCKNNLKQIGLAMHNYHDTHGKFPVSDDPEWLDENGKPHLSWRVHVLPFMDQIPLYHEFHLDEPWNSAHNIKLVSKMPRVYKCPEGNLPTGETTYLGIAGPGGILEKPGVGIRDVTDGLSNTILVLDAADSKAVVWTQPVDFMYSPSNPMSGLAGHHGDSFNALLSDGAARLISLSLPTKTILGLFTMSGGENISGF